MKAISSAIAWGLIGLVVGYGIFAKFNGDYVDLDVIFAQKKGFLDNLASSIIGLDEMRKNILMCGVGGAALGLVLGVIPTGGNNKYTTQPVRRKEEDISESILGDQVLTKSEPKVPAKGIDEICPFCRERSNKTEKICNVCGKQKR